MGGSARSLRAGGLGLCLLPLLAGCAVGPDFKRPAPPAVGRYTADPLPARTAAAPGRGGAAQRLAAGRDIPGEWWELFRSPQLDRLIKEALRRNPNLAAAEAALRQAHELTLAGRGAFFPLVQASFEPSRNKTPAVLGPTPANNALYFNLFTPQLTISYTPDVFGGTRRTVESLAAQEENQRFQLEAAYLTLTSGLVAAVIGEAELREEIAATEKIIKVERVSLGILRRQLVLGQVAGADVAAQQATLAQAEAGLPPLQKELARQRDLIAVLVGRYPSQQPAARFDLAALHLPREVPVSLPSRLVAQRPDIRAAEASLHAASAEIGVATANMLPSTSLSANAGASALTFASLFGPGTGFWTLVANVTQTIFDAGTLLHQKRAAEAAFKQAAAQYRETVLTAFQDVADSLHALESDADALKAAAAAEAAAKQSLDIARRQLKAGAITYLGILQAEQTYQQALISRVHAEAARFADTAALFQALGGGWWHRKDVPPQATKDGAALLPAALLP
jgi:NodT family efflux transporter outer membrane factor (OMF) lipoprotein